MRTRAGFVVRFVDVVLILLFGFISISTIRETNVVLPSSAEAILLPPNTEETVYVGIDSDGRYLVDEEHQVLFSADELQQYLQGVVMQSVDTPAVRVRAMYDAPMGPVKTAVQLCTALGLDTSLAVRLGGGETPQ